ncbi:MAG: dephospho-CoA kinase [Bacteroidetes bacterium]|nr:dephospho-CoA kinase [Bacteroidota bacterium]HET6244367.1 dephospho-CoA kinase [Bacteroidia bacterium]
MIKLGITGGIGSGKTLVCSVFHHLGIPFYNADLEAKRLVNSNKEISDFIKKEFGKDLFTTQGLDRKKLAELIFNNPSALSALNAKVHPEVKKDFELWVQKQNQAPYVIKEAAILFESGAYKHVDKIITVVAPENIRIERAIKRDNVTESEVRKRMSFQSSDEFKVQKSDFVISNDGVSLLLPQIIRIHENMLSLP